LTWTVVKTRKIRMSHWLNIMFHYYLVCRILFGIPKDI